MAWVSKRSTPLVTRLYAGDQVVAVGPPSHRTAHAAPGAAARGGRGWHQLLFEVNGREVFIGGANWILDDNLLERITPERYRQRVEQAAAGNMNMLRVWAGGIYEDDAFTTPVTSWACWSGRDFLFACGLYPAHAEFQASVRAEAEAAVRRLRHRACLALWCGNNEDYAIAESIGAYGPQAPLGAFRRARSTRSCCPPFAPPDPDRPYWPGSRTRPTPPASRFPQTRPWATATRGRSGTRPCCPTSATPTCSPALSASSACRRIRPWSLLERSLPEAERYPESRTMVWHNKAGSGAPDGHRRLAVYLSDNLRAGTSLADQVYATQFIQAEAMRVAYQDFRRRWQRPGARAVGGALVWQLNDCWPVTSWALIDSAGTVKPAWHAIRRAMAPLSRSRCGRRKLTSVHRDERGLDPRTHAAFFKTFDLQGNCRFEQTLGGTADNDVSADGWIALPDSDITVVAEVIATDARTNSEISRDCAWPGTVRSRISPFASVGFTALIAA